jgi:hypothetical protein
MDLIDRYVAEVGRHLPRKNRNDIQAELRSVLEDNLEARSNGAPTEGDVITLLKEYGSPRKVAASYWPEGQYLIGPRLYPLFQLVAGIVLTVLVIVQLILFGITAVFHPEASPGLAFFGDLLGEILSALGAIVLTFAILQRLDVQPKMEDDDWNPKDLPAKRDNETINRAGVVVEIIFTMVIIILLVMGLYRTGIFNWPGAEIILNPVILKYAPLIILSSLLSIGLDVILLWRGRWETASYLAKIGLNLFGVYILGLLISGTSAWLVSQGVDSLILSLGGLPAGDILQMQQIELLTMQALRIAFVVALIALVIDTVRIAYHLVRNLFARPDLPGLPSEKANQNSQR